MPHVGALSRELDGYVHVLLGRKPPPDPINADHTEALMEYASTVYARGQEIAIQLHKLEREGHVMKGSDLYKFRTGELRTFIELAKGAMDMGSRRITVARMAFDQSKSELM